LVHIKRTKIVATRYFSPAQNIPNTFTFAVGALPRTPLWELIALPRLFAGFKGRVERTGWKGWSVREERERKGRGREGEGRESGAPIDT